MKRFRSLASLFLLLVLSSGLNLPGAHAADAGDDETWQVPVTIGKDGWMLYENQRFGSVLPVPPGMVPLRPPDNGDGQRFATRDDKVHLATWGGFNVDGLGDVETNWQAALAKLGRTITYKRKTAEWYVVSGVMKDGTGFYERHTANAKYVAGWIITYPQAEEKKCSAWVERIAKGYEARLGKGLDTVE